ncbi:MAG: hypothetical protein OYH77_02185 [Pseudomonadota bacterium]|nr:hypothetical protein [Pseudomonadota bacterium]
MVLLKIIKNSNYLWWLARMPSGTRLLSAYRRLLARLTASAFGHSPSIRLSATVSSPHS